ncbi:uncharacterized protein LOC120143315 isoform X1 [Hibiscus syriacus]|uniref:uncharacterized protein LOC120143305 isoform X1 n=1 Tax=Hibiscus syriacus TaxID=106335 RepID=UPI001920E455|nr:uncharacterized protein LOC120143305 isoform X1 [Hibiscus syriacus]XP_039013599.1 uncharacterized protein LOC120143315 isoform X1 [Hibiscus syriacus]
MGNCQAVDAAALVIQHPSGRLERLYWQIPASEVMRMNPGHYVSLIIPLPASEDEQGNRDRNTVRFTRVKLLQPTETLTLGHAYRLITSQEVMKVMRAKKYAKTKRESMKKLLQHEQENLSSGRKSDADNTDQVQELKQERQSSRTPPANAAAMRSKSWRPSLQSISEAGS